MKKIYILEGNDVTYEGLIGEQVIKLSTSNSDVWNGNKKGVTKGDLRDDGNGIQIHFQGKRIKLDYSQIVELHTLLDLKLKYDKSSYEPLKYLVEDNIAG